MNEVQRIAVYKKPDLDALAAVWIAQRYICQGKPFEVVFFPKGHPIYREERVVWIAEPTCGPALEVGWGHKRLSFAQRYADSATGHIWSYLQGMGRALNHLIDMVDAVHAGVTGQAPDGMPWEDTASKLADFWRRAKRSVRSDQALLQTVCEWLDDYDNDLRRYSTTPPDWEQIASRLPEGPGTYALILACLASRAFLVGRTGNLGRMVTQQGYYVYLGSAMNGLRGRDKHHLTPVDILKAKWQVDSLRLVCTLEEIWYTASQHRWECPWARCMMALPGAQIPEPKRFGASGCDGKCITHLPFFAEKPSLKTFRSGVSKLSPAGCQIDRLVVRHEG